MGVELMMSTLKTVCDSSPLDCETTYVLGGIALALGFNWLVKDNQKKEEE